MSRHILRACCILPVLSLISIRSFELCNVAFAAAPRFDDGRPRPVTRTFRLKELLEHTYSDELVSFPVAFRPGECLPASLRLSDDTSGTEIPFQTSDAQTNEKSGDLISAKVWFWVDSLPAMGERSYTLHGSSSKKCRPPRLAGRQEVTYSDLEEDSVEISNGVFSLRVSGNATFAEPRRAEEVGGPLRGFKGVDGVWRGAGELQVESPVKRHILKIVEQGPLWTVFVSRFYFVSPPGTGGTSTGPFYEMRCTIYPGRDFCRVTEKSTFPLRLQPMPRDAVGIPENADNTDTWRTIPCPADNFLLNCDANWKADRLYAANTFSTKFVNHPLLPDRLRVHTAIRPALPFMDAGWFATYST